MRHGPIEAMIRFLRCGMHYKTFRAQCGTAPLKHWWIYEYCGEMDFPCPMRHGPIEAATFVYFPIIIIVSFRAQCGTAPLKLSKCPIW